MATSSISLSNQGPSSSSSSSLHPEENSNHNNNKQFERFLEWVHCICVVTFDLELGQAMELIYPETSALSEQEKINVCYLAFPDSNSGCMGDTQFHIRLRLSPDNTDAYQLNSTLKKFNSQCIAVQKPDLAHYWGFVYFRQKKDTTITRGYFQKSFIILTRLPFFNLFNEIVSQIAPKYFQDGLSVLQLVYEHISAWPSLKAGEQFGLPLLGTVYQTIIPKSNSKSHNSNTSNNTKIYNINSNNIGLMVSASSSSSLSEICQHLNDQTDCDNCNSNVNDNVNTSAWPLLRNNSIFGPALPPQVLASVHEIDIFRSLSSHITNIYTLWELVLIAEPIVVMGSSPADCSHMVQSLISLISPLEYCGECRPYFTIHDSEFREFTSKTNTNNGTTGTGEGHNNLPSIIIGVTNPFFAKLLQNWPHMLKLPDTSQQPYPVLPKYSTSNDPAIQINSVAAKKKMAAGHLNNNSLSNIGGNTSSSGIGSVGNIINNSIIGDNNSAGVYTKYKPFLKKDKSLIKKVQLGIKTKRPEQVQSALLRRHFLELTQSFMIPLERYMASLMPLQKDISPFKSAPNPSQFKQDDFLETLDISGPQLTSTLRGNWRGLYKKFFETSNFKGWYENRHKELKHTLQALQLQALSDADLVHWAQGKQEVEIIDMILKLKQKLRLCSDSQLIIDDVLNPNTQAQLIKQLDNITKSLPDDLKNIIYNSS